MPLDFLTALKKLPLDERLQIIETLILEIRQELHLPPPIPLSSRKRQMQAAAAALREDYRTDADLTAFTALDAQDFHAEG